MKFLVALSCLLAVAAAKPGVLAPLAYSVAPAHNFGYNTVSQHHEFPAHYAAPYAHAYSAVAPIAHTYSAVTPFAHGYTAVAPVAHAYSAVTPFAHTYAAVAPIVHPIHALEKSQYHAQDGFGQASYGHAEAFQTHNAIQDAAGNKAGAYSYVAPNGEVFTTKYTADARGFHVESNAAPVAPAESAEIIAAREEHLKTYEEVKNRSRRAAVFVAPHAFPYSAYPYGHAYGYAAHPYAYAAPIAVHTPVVGHTTAYDSVVSTPFSHTESFAVKHF